MALGRRLRLLSAIVVFGSLASSAAGQQSGHVNLESEPIQPLPQKLVLNPEKVALGGRPVFRHTAVEPLRIVVHRFVMVDGIQRQENPRACGNLVAGDLRVLHRDPPPDGLR